MKFSEPLPGYTSRSIRVDDIPDFRDGPMIVTVTYDGHGTGHKGIALDHHVMPLIKAAPDMRELLARAVNDWPAFDAEEGEDDEVNGADLVEWFSEWRHRAKALLAKLDKAAS